VLVACREQPHGHFGLELKAEPHLVAGGEHVMTDSVVAGKAKAIRGKAVPRSCCRGHLDPSRILLVAHKFWTQVLLLTSFGPRHAPPRSFPALGWLCMQIKRGLELWQSCKCIGHTFLDSLKIHFQARACALTVHKFTSNILHPELACRCLWHSALRSSQGCTCPLLC